MRTAPRTSHRSDSEVLKTRDALPPVSILPTRREVSSARRRRTAATTESQSYLHTRVIGGWPHCSVLSATLWRIKHEDSLQLPECLMTTKQLCRGAPQSTEAYSQPHVPAPWRERSATSRRVRFRLLARQRVSGATSSASS